MTSKYENTGTEDAFQNVIEGGRGGPAGGEAISATEEGEDEDEDEDEDDENEDEDGGGESDREAEEARGKADISEFERDEEEGVGEETVGGEREWLWAKGAEEEADIGGERPGAGLSADDLAGPGRRRSLYSSSGSYKCGSPLEWQCSSAVSMNLEGYEDEMEASESSL